MKADIRFWKFWAWDVLLALGLVSLLLLGEFAIASPTTAAMGIFLGIFAYRLTTGVFAGAGKWAVYFVGTSFVAVIAGTLPVAAVLWLKNQNTAESLPLAPLVGWVVFLFAVLLVCQRKMFYRLVRRVHVSRMEKADLIAWKRQRFS